MPSQEQSLDALKQVKFPGLSRDIVFTPWFSIGMIFSSVSSICGRPVMPSIICCEGP